MSLVNDMLRDLDRRKRHISGEPGSGYSYDDDMSNVVGKRIKLVMLTFVGILVGGVAVLVYFKGAALESLNSASRSEYDIVIPINEVQPDPGAVAANVAATRIDSQAENSIRLFERENTESGFTVGIASRQQLSYEIVSRNQYGIDLLISDVDNVESNAVRLGGFSLVQQADGVHAVIELNQLADFRVYEESGEAGEPGITLFIEAVLDTAPVVEVAPVQAVAVEEAGEAVVQEPQPEPVVAPAVEVVSTEPAPPESRTEDPAESQPVRMPRELSLEDQDINVSQTATQLIQRGQLTAAYQVLLDFIGENPEAHRSRETLATVLFAQQEFAQANAIVDQGLSIAPNFTAYKKLKARLYLMNDQTVEAVQMLRSLPPEVDSDPEYFELLASSYQQNGEYQNAISVYQQLLRYDSQRARWWAGLGIAHESLGNVDDAIASYQAAMQVPGLESALRQYSQNRIRYLRN